MTKDDIWDENYSPPLTNKELQDKIEMLEFEISVLRSALFKFAKLFAEEINI